MVASPDFKKRSKSRKSSIETDCSRQSHIKCEDKVLKISDLGTVSSLSSSERENTDHRVFNESRRRTTIKKPGFILKNSRQNVDSEVLERHPINIFSDFKNALSQLDFMSR